MSELNLVLYPAAAGGQRFVYEIARGSVGLIPLGRNRWDIDRDDFAYKIPRDKNADLEVSNENSKYMAMHRAPHTYESSHSVEYYQKLFSKYDRLIVYILEPETKQQMKCLVHMAAHKVQGPGFEKGFKKCLKIIEHLDPPAWAFNCLKSRFRYYYSTGKYARDMSPFKVDEIIHINPFDLWTGKYKLSWHSDTWENYCEKNLHFFEKNCLQY